MVVHPALVSSLHARTTREQKCDINQEREWETVSANMKGTLPDGIVAARVRLP